jgi:diguanylate cyclase (GGDEF)-like protein/PAS domain S-box-containing protein
MSLILVLMVMTAVFWWGYHQLTQFMLSTISDRATSVVETIALTLESIEDRHAVQRVVSALSAEKGTQLLVVIAGKEQRVIAASKLSWIGLTIDQISDQHVRAEAKNSWQKSEPDIHGYPDHTVDFIVPIRISHHRDNQLVLDDGLVVVNMDNSAAVAQAEKFVVTMGSVLALLWLGLLVALVSGWWHLLWRPMSSLRHAMRMRVMGQSVEAPEAPSRELSELVNVYNVMIREEQYATSQLLLLQGVFKNSQDGVILLSEQYDVVMINDASQQMLGMKKQNLVGQGVQSLFVGTPLEALNFWQKLLVKGAWSGVVNIVREQTTLLPVQVSIMVVRDQRLQMNSYLMFLTDLSAQHAAEAHIRFLSEYDTLTGLANQNQLIQVINYRTNAGVHPFAVVLLDLDRFKHVNEALGHDVGNQLLQKVAQRLETFVYAEELLARMSGDEFAMVLNVDDSALLSQRLHQILLAMAEPYYIEGLSLTASVSMGVSLYPQDSLETNTLLAHADSALYQAKANGRNAVEFFSFAAGKDQLQLLRLEADLRQAIERHELLLHFQPQVDIATGHIVGVESLARWQHPTLGMVSPVEFIPLAEETGLIVAIGAWVLDQACAQASQWEAQGMPIRVAVNVSVLQFTKSDYVASVKNALATHKLTPNLLELELTESIMALSKRQLKDIFTELKAMGIQLALDDFGTGFSSLSYLEAFPLDRLKIDQSFIRSMIDQEDGASLGVVKAIIELGNAFGLSAIAEGVETQEQFDQLKALGCEEFQGYLCSRPMTAEACTAFYWAQQKGQNI